MMGSPLYACFSFSPTWTLNTCVKPKRANETQISIIIDAPLARYCILLSNKCDISQHDTLNLSNMLNKVCQNMTLIWLIWIKGIRLILKSIVSSNSQGFEMSFLRIVVFASPLVMQKPEASARAEIFETLFFKFLLIRTPRWRCCQMSTCRTKLTSFTGPLPQHRK